MRSPSKMRPWLGFFLLIGGLVAVALIAMAMSTQTRAIAPVAAVAQEPKRILIPTATPKPPTPTPRPTRAAAPNSTVTLRAAPGNSQVQMFDALRDGPNVNVSTFRDGFQCSQISSRLRFGEGDMAMFFYKLNCGGKIGYVNAKWVRR